MEDRNEVLKTGDRVLEEGGYVCEVGQRRDLRAGEECPVCPVGGGETSWRRENAR